MSTLLIDLTARPAEGCAPFQPALTAPGQAGDFLFLLAEARRSLHRVQGEETQAGLESLRQRLEAFALVEGALQPRRILVVIDGSAYQKWPERIRLDTILEALPTALREIPSIFLRVAMEGAATEEQPGSDWISQLQSRDRYELAPIPDPLRKRLEAMDRVPEMKELTGEESSALKVWEQLTVEKVKEYIGTALDGFLKKTSGIEMRDEKSSDLDLKLHKPFERAMQLRRKDLEQEFEAAFTNVSSLAEGLETRARRCFADSVHQSLVALRANLIDLRMQGHNPAERLRLILTLQFLAEEPVWDHCFLNKSDYPVRRHAIEISLRGDLAGDLAGAGRWLESVEDALNKKADAPESKSVTVCLWEQANPGSPGGDQDKPPQGFFDHVRQLLSANRFRLSITSPSDDKRVVEPALLKLDDFALRTAHKHSVFLRGLRVQMGRSVQRGVSSTVELSPEDVERKTAEYRADIGKAADLEAGAGAPVRLQWANLKQRLMTEAHAMGLSRPRREQVLMTVALAIAVLGATVALGVAAPPSATAVDMVVAPASALLMGAMGTLVLLLRLRHSHARKLHGLLLNTFDKFSKAETEAVKYGQDLADAANKARNADANLREIEAAVSRSKERADLLRWHADRLGTLHRDVYALAMAINPDVRPGIVPVDRGIPDLHLIDLSAPYPPALHPPLPARDKVQLSFGSHAQASRDLDTQVPGVERVTLAELKDAR